MDDQLRLDRHLEEFFAQAKAISLSADERQRSRVAIESYLMAHSVSLVPADRLQDRMDKGKSTSVFPDLFLDRKEKGRVRRNIIEFMRQNPCSLQQEEIDAPAISLYRIFEVAFPRFALGVLVFVGVGASVTFASQASVPGDFLYPFKVSVYEPFVSKLATSETSQAAWEAHRAQLRLREAAKLADEERLTKEKAKQLRAQFEEHLAQTQRSIDVLNAAGKKDTALSIQTELETYLDSNSTIVREISADEEGRGGMAAAAKLPSSEDKRNEHHEPPHGHSLEEKVMKILSLPSSSVAASRTSSSSDDGDGSSSRQNGKSSAPSSQREGHSSSEPDTHSEEMDHEESHVSSASDIVPQVPGDVLEQASSVEPLLPQLAH